MIIFKIENGDDGGRKIMALISCPECKRKVSGNAVSCPHCGYALQPGKIICPKCKSKNVKKMSGLRKFSISSLETYECNICKYKW